MSFQFTTGGLTAAPAFISTYADDSPSTTSRNCPFSNIIVGEDGVEYFVGGGGDDGVSTSSSSLFIHRVSDGTRFLTKTSAQMSTDATAAFGASFMDNQENGSFAASTHMAVAIPGTPYVLVMNGAAAGVDVSKALLYYKINSSSQLELMYGYSGTEDGLSATQFRPKDGMGWAALGAGFLLDDLYKTPTGAGSTIGYQYPILIMVFGESQSTTIACPSINGIAAVSPIIETTGSDVYTSKELFLSTTYGANILDTADRPDGASTTRGFTLPRAEGAGSFMCQMFMTSQMEAYAASTESVTNAYLTSAAASYPDGLISAATLSLNTNPWESKSSKPIQDASEVAFHARFVTQALAPAFPFPDDNQDVDGTPGSSLDNYYCNPTTYPSDPSDPSSSWIVFFPKIYRGQSADQDTLGIRVFEWDPETETARLLDFKTAELFTTGSDVNAASEITQAAVYWNSVTGDVKVQMSLSYVGGSEVTVSTFGSFSPVSADAATISEDLLTRAWAFELDSHSFYALRLGEQGTFVYDMLTQQFSEWVTQGYPVWNAVHGVAWNGIIVAGDLSDGVLWQVDPDSDLDEDTKPITHTVTGILPNRERSPQRLMELRVMGSVGDPYTDGSSVSLAWSDDQGQSYSTPLVVNLTDGDNSQVIRFRSLGRFDSPLRLFDITDVGGMVRIDGADVEIK